MASEKRKYNSKLNGKGLERSVTEDQARHMALNQGTSYVFVVQAHAGPKTVAEDGSEVVSLIPDLVELVPGEHAERVMDFQRALYLARPEQFGQQAFETAGANEPKVDEAAAALDAVVERSDEGEVTGAWSGDPDAPLHVVGDAGCPFPGCQLDADHDGDHDVPDGAGTDES